MDDVKRNWWLISLIELHIQCWFHKSLVLYFSVYIHTTDSQYSFVLFSRLSLP